MKRRHCGWNDTFLTEVLTGTTTLVYAGPVVGGRRTRTPFHAEQSQFRVIHAAERAVCDGII